VKSSRVTVTVQIRKAIVAKKIILPMQKHILKAATKISNCASRAKVSITLHPQKAAILRAPLTSASTVELREGATADLRWGNGDRAPRWGCGKGRRGRDPWRAAAGSGAAGFRGGVVATAALPTGAAVAPCGEGAASSGWAAAAALRARDGRAVVRGSGGAAS
jgi:hypothetical protein